MKIRQLKWIIQKNSKNLIKMSLKTNSFKSSLKNKKLPTKDLIMRYFKSLSKP